MQSRLFTTVVSSLLFFLTPSLRAADVKWPAKIGSWTASSQPTKISSFTADPAFLPISKESGFVEGSSQNYKSANQEVQLTLYAFHDSSGAYEAFTAIAAAEGPNKRESTVVAN